MKQIPVHTDFIRLDAFMKLCNMVGSGGEAKVLIQNGEVLVNGEVCTMRGKKLRCGDSISFHGEEAQVTAP